MSIIDEYLNSHFPSWSLQTNANVGTNVCLSNKLMVFSTSSSFSSNPRSYRAEIFRRSSLYMSRTRGRPRLRLRKLLFSILEFSKLLSYVMLVPISMPKSMIRSVVRAVR